MKLNIKLNMNIDTGEAIDINRCLCGSEDLDIYPHYSSVYERIHGYAKCKTCGKIIWGKVTFDTYDVNTSSPDFPEWKHNSYVSVEKAIIEEWNKHNPEIGGNY